MSTLTGKCMQFLGAKTPPLLAGVTDFKKNKDNEEESGLSLIQNEYIQKGVLLTAPPFSITHFISLLRQSLSVTLSHFLALAGRLFTNSDGHISILCNYAGIDFIHAKATFLSVNNLLSPIDVPDSLKEFFAFLASFRSFFSSFDFFSAAPSWKT
ncbi:hypothetical protein WN943_005499 [Citrus x changshan-huyou]